MMINYLKDGAFFPVGGTQEFANAIFKKFIDFGGHVMLSSRVKKILLNDNYVRGIKLQNDNEISSGLVVSNIDAQQTFIDLLEGKMDSSFLKKIEGMRESCSFFLLYLGVGGDVDLTKLKRGFYHTATDASTMGKEWLYISVPTKICPTLAPSNKQIISVVVYLNKVMYKNVPDWKSFKESMTLQTINRLEFIYSGFK